MISVTVLTKNSEKTLKSTLQSLTSFAEVILWDTGSLDTTLQIAQEFSNVRICHAPFRGFGPTHNDASRRASHDWILSIDSDEILSAPLIEELHLLTLDPACVYAIKRHNYFNNKHIKWCGGWHPDHVIRLYHKKSTRFSDDAVHEKIIATGLKLILLRHPMQHTPYQGMDDFLSKMQNYSTLFAAQYAGKRKSSLFQAIVHAFFAFLKSYVFKRGFLGGKEGFIISTYNAQTAFYKYLKLAEANKKLTNF